MHWLDYCVFVSALLVSLSIGVYYNFTKGGQRTLDAYLVANRELRVVPAAVSMFMSMVSGVLVLGMSAEMYMYGIQNTLACLFRAPLYGISSMVFVPMFYKLKLTSVYEYHRRRYNSELLQLICVFVNILSGTMLMALAMYAPATALETVTGLPLWASLLCTGAVALAYTTIGGIKAVVWTDFIQSFVMIFGLLTIVIAGTFKVDGILNVFKINYDKGRIFLDSNPDPTKRITVWTVMFGSSLLALTQCASEQTQIQRYCALPTMKCAIFVTLLQIPFLILTYSVISLCGMITFAYYDRLGCDPYRSYSISSSNQILPYFVVHGLSLKGLTGTLIAVIYTGALSTLSSSMNSMAAVTWKEICEKRFQHFSETKKTVVTKLLTLAYGLLGIFVAYWMRYFKGHIYQLASSLIVGLAGPMTGVVLLGMLCPRVHSRGVITGLLLGVSVYMVMNWGQIILYTGRSYLNTTTDKCIFHGNITSRIIPDDDITTFWLFRISFQYIPLAGLLTSIIGGVVASYLIPRPAGHIVNPQLIFKWKDIGLTTGNNAQEQSELYTRPLKNDDTELQNINA